MGRFVALTSIVLRSFLPLASGFASYGSLAGRRQSDVGRYYSEFDDEVEGTSFTGIPKSLKNFKQELLALGSKKNKGFGFSGWRSQGHAMSLVEQIEASVTTEMLPDNVDELEGAWRLCWTKSVDVLGLNVDPLWQLDEICHVVKPEGFVTTMIEFVPRAQMILPKSVIPNTNLRVAIARKASSRTTHTTTKLSLELELVRLQPTEILGREVDIYPPVQLEIPQALHAAFPNSTKTFNVTYLDSDMAILRQLEPLSGVIALVKESDIATT